jgi:predicted transcriptional regulator of viral defense system
MLFQEFNKAMFSQGCFTSNQVFAWRQEFDKNNMGRWVQKGLLLKLRNGYYTFPDYLTKPNFGYYLANRIYKPSYISLHSALAFYGLIPESVVQITSVTTLKTAEFQNAFGTFNYKTIKPAAMFGFDYLPFMNDRTLLLAKPEKAILDLLYLYPFYKTETDFESLRLDEDIVAETIKKEIMLNYLEKFANKALENRVHLLLKVYDL